MPRRVGFLFTPAGTLVVTLTCRRAWVSRVADVPGYGEGSLPQSGNGVSMVPSGGYGSRIGWASMRRPSTGSPWS